MSALSGSFFRKKGVLIGIALVLIVAAGVIAQAVMKSPRFKDPIMVKWVPRNDLQVDVGKGCCYDNACVESFFHSLKVECIHGERFINREIMRTTVFNYIECDYNRWRRHSACGGLSPEQFENQNLA